MTRGQSLGPGQGGDGSSCRVPVGRQDRLRPVGVRLPSGPFVAPPAPALVEQPGDATPSARISATSAAVQRPRSIQPSSFSSSLYRHEPSGETTMSSSRSCVSTPRPVRRNGSWMFTYHAPCSRSAPCQKTQMACISPGRWSWRTRGPPSGPCRSTGAARRKSRAQTRAGSTPACRARAAPACRRRRSRPRRPWAAHATHLDGRRCRRVASSRAGTAVAQGLSLGHGRKGQAAPSRFSPSRA
jgi:hypothetical protein